MRLNKYERLDHYQIFETVNCDGKTVRVYIDTNRIEYLVRWAVKSKGGQASSGPVTARILK